MKRESNKPDPSEAALVMEAGDRFHQIFVSDGIKYEIAPGFETVITFFVIRRAAGTFEVVNITKTFNGDKCVSRNVQIKACYVPHYLTSCVLDYLVDAA